MVQRKRLTNEIRDLICSKYAALKPISQIAEELDLNPKTVRSVIRVQQETGRTHSAMNRTGRKKKVTPEISEFVKNQIDDEVSITLETLKNKISQHFDLTLSKSTINNMIDAFNYSFKRVVLVPAARNKPENIAKRFEYAGIFTQIPQDSLIFLDECGISCSIRKSHGRSLRGTTPRKTVRSIRSKNISISAAITKNRVYFF